MKKIALLLVLAIISISTQAQDKIITVQNGNKATFYTHIDSAIKYAPKTATIYLPGGDFGSVTINKEVHIVGVGYHKDSSGMNGRTIITIVFDTNSINSTMKGLKLTGGGINANAKDISISNCFFNSSNGFSNCSFFNSYLYINGIYSNCFIKNCIIYSRYSGSRFEKSTIHNSIIIDQYYLTGNYIKFHNCIFNPKRGGGAGFFIGNSLFNYCVNSSYHKGKHNNTHTNDISYSALLDSIFVKPIIDGTCTWDFHFRKDKSYKRNGSDGTEIGVYGGSSPWNQSGRPANVPFIKSSTVSPQTDKNGNLDIKFEVLPNGQ